MTDQTTNQTTVGYISQAFTNLWTWIYPYPDVPEVQVLDVPEAPQLQSKEPIPTFDETLCEARLAALRLKQKYLVDGLEKVGLTRWHVLLSIEKCRIKVSTVASRMTEAQDAIYKLCGKYNEFANTDDLFTFDTDFAWNVTGEKWVFNL